MSEILLHLISLIEFVLEAVTECRIDIGYVRISFNS